MKNIGTIQWNTTQNVGWITSNLAVHSHMLHLEGLLFKSIKLLILVYSGARVCIGNNFSLLEQKMFLVQVLQNFKLELENPNYVIETSNRGPYSPSEKFTMKFNKRIVQ